MKKEPRPEPATAPSKMPAALSALLGTRKGARATTSRREWLALKPVRNPALLWREEEGIVVIEIRRVQNWKVRLVSLIFPVPESHTVALDAIGSAVWLSCDGEASVEQIAKHLARELQMERREIEASLQDYFKTLGRRGYIAFKIENAGNDAPST